MAELGDLWAGGASHQLQGLGAVAGRGESSEGRVISCRGWGAVAGRGVIRLQEKSSGLAHVLLVDAVLNGVIRSHAPFGYGHGTAQRRQGVG